MHQLWSADELREHWVLTGEELALLRGMSERRRLVFCYYLKYFQLHAQFPRAIDYVPEEISDFLATQIGTAAVRLPDVPDRTDRYYRHQVIEFLNIGRFDGKVQTAFLEWLTCEVLPTAPNPLSLDAMITKWFLAHSIARLKAKRIARLCAQAERRFERNVFAMIASRLTVTQREGLDALLETDNSPSRFAEICQSTGAAGVDNVLNTVKRLETLRNLSFDAAVLGDVHPDIVEKLACGLARKMPGTCAGIPMRPGMHFCAAFAFHGKLN